MYQVSSCLIKAKFRNTFTVGFLLVTIIYLCLFTSFISVSSEAHPARLLDWFRCFQPDERGEHFHFWEKGNLIEALVAKDGYFLTPNATCAPTCPEGNLTERWILLTHGSRNEERDFLRHRPDFSCQGHFANSTRKRCLSCPEGCGTCTAGLVSPVVSWMTWEIHGDFGGMGCGLLSWTGRLL